MSHRAERAGPYCFFFLNLRSSSSKRRTSNLKENWHGCECSTLKARSKERERKNEKAVSRRQLPPRLMVPSGSLEDGPARCSTNRQGRLRALSFCEQSTFDTKQWPFLHVQHAHSVSPHAHCKHIPKAANCVCIRNLFLFEAHGCQEKDERERRERKETHRSSVRSTFSFHCTSVCPLFTASAATSSRKSVDA